MSLGYVRNAVVVSCNERDRWTRRLAQNTRQATVLVVAARVAGLIRKEHVCGSAVVLDVGISSVTDDATGEILIVSDVDSTTVAAKG